MVDAGNQGTFSGLATIARSVRCGRCRYELRGLPLDGACPECGLAVWTSVEAVIDPEARRLPTLRNPRRVGDALVGTMACLVVAMLLIVARPVALRLEAIGAIDFVAWTSPSLARIAGGVALIAILPVRLFAPPRGAERGGLVPLAIAGLTLGFALAAAALLIAGDRLSLPPPAAGRAVVEGAVIAAFVVIMASLRAVLRIVGERSRQFRTARGGRQRTVDMIAAAAGVALGETLRTLGALGGRPALGTVGTVVVWISGLMLVIGLIYLLANVVWIRRSLRRPPPALVELLRPEPPASLAAEDDASDDA